MPGKRSTTATHPARAEIEARLRKGDPAAHVARDFDLSRQAVSRAKAKIMAKPAGQTDGDRAAMRQQIQSLYNATVDLVRQAKEANAPRAFLAATAEARKCLGLLSKILGILDAAPAPPVVVVNVNIEELRAVMVAALGPYPEAGAAVAAALIEYDQRAPGEA